MDIGLIMRIAGIGILVAVINQVLSKSGRDEHAMLVTVAGVVTVLLMLVREIAALFEAVRTAFGL
ncbi:MAG: stage III sporulation protein AC [Ruminococcaceae bacterium]|nr:stage III sporulation protein AC [Oscillospiraceae bacterium]